MHNPTMLYRCPGQHITDGIAYDYVIVEEGEIESKLSEGWHRNWHDADAALKGAAEKLAENERELAKVEQQLEAAGEPVSGEMPGAEGQAAPQLTAVHKGRGKWAVVDAAGNEVQSGLTREEAQAAVA